MTNKRKDGPIIIGLTGSIGMGKSTTASMFADAGAVVWNADTAVHRLYARGGAAVGPVGEAFPGVVRDGTVDRNRLAEVLGQDGDGFQRLEAIVHPLHQGDKRGRNLRTNVRTYVHTHG